MPSKTVRVGPNGYTELDTTPGSALDCQNVSSNLIRVVFSSTQPTSGGYKLYPDKGISRNGHTGSMWATCENKAVAEVEVGE